MQSVNYEFNRNEVANAAAVEILNRVFAKSKWKGKRLFNSSRRCALNLTFTFT